MSESTEGNLGFTPELLEALMLAKADDLNQFAMMFPDDSDDEEEFTEDELKNDPRKRILWAAENNHTSEAETILKESPDLVRTCDGDRYTPLHRASYNGHADMVKLLLSHGADITAMTVDGWRPLHSAARWNNASVISVLLQNGANVNAVTNSGQTALHLASSNKESQDSLQVLLMHPGIDVNITNSVGDTARRVCERTSQYHTLFDITEDSINICR